MKCISAEQILVKYPILYWELSSLFDDLSYLKCCYMIETKARLV